MSGDPEAGFEEAFLTEVMLISGTGAQLIISQRIQNIYANDSHSNSIQTITVINH